LKRELPQPDQATAQAAPPTRRQLVKDHLIANPLLKERADFIYIIVEFQLVNPRFQAGRGRLGLSQHLDILNAILAGDLPAAERHLIHHLQSAEETLRGVTGGLA
jgi:DNA-binding GntR family transcriptional regulator